MMAKSKAKSRGTKRWPWLAVGAIVLVALVLVTVGRSGKTVRPRSELPEDIEAAILAAGELEPFFLDAEGILVLDYGDVAGNSSLGEFLGGWGVVLDDGTVVLNEARVTTIYNAQTGMPMEVNQAPANGDVTIIRGMNLPEEWRGLTITTIPPYDRGFPHYVGTAMPRVIPTGDAPQNYQTLGLWYWQGEKYVPAMEGVDRGETFRFEQAEAELV